MAPVLAIAGVVARTVDADDPLTPLERFLNLSSPGRTGSHLSLRSEDDDRQEAIAEPEGEKGMGAAVAIGGPRFRGGPPARGRDRSSPPDDAGPP
jgi:hypothetical protein